MKMRSKSMKFKHSISLVALAAMLAPSAAYAQVDEIIVTAQKRAESLSDVPIAVTAYTAESMEVMGIQTASDLVDMTPGLSSTQQSGSNKNFFLRGVGTTDFHLTAAPAVGQYFDGVTLTSGFHARAALFDMERVEVLKGPQNTLFGLNTTAGAINYISKKPEIGAGTNGRLKAHYGHDNEFGVDAALGFDIGDTMAARIAVHTNRHDGPFVSTFNGKDYGDDELLAYRGTFLWEPSDRTSLTLNLHGADSKGNGGAVKAVGTRAPVPSTDQCADFTGGIVDFEADTNCTSRDGRNNGTPRVDPSTGVWESSTQGFGFEEVSTQGFYAKLDQDLGFATLNLIGSYDNLEFQSANDSDGTSSVLLHLQQEDDRDTMQYEARLVSNADSALRWIGGVYYLDEEAESYTGAISPGVGGGARIANVQLDHTKTNLGIYGQAEYDLSDSLTVTGGVRWSDEDINVDYLPSSPNALTDIVANTPLFADEVDALVRAQFAGVAGRDANGYELNRQVSRKSGNEDVGYTVKLDWKATDNALLYASYSKGFKGGAADARAAFALVPPANIQADLDASQLKSEGLLAYELGYKGSFADNKIRVDAAAFYYDYTNLQQFITAGGAPQLSNAPGSEIYGLDGNIKYANDSGFYLDVGATLLKSEITESGTSVFLEGAELPNTPSLALSALASQEFEIGDDNLLTISANVSHTGEVIKQALLAATSNTGPIRTQPAFTLVGANASYQFGSNQQYELSIYGKNLLDEHFCGFRGVNEGNRALTDGISTGRPTDLSAVATCRVTRASTRTFGASFGVEF